MRIVDLNTPEGMKEGYEIVKKWESEGYGYRFVHFKKKSRGGWMGMGYRLRKVKLVRG
jgi:hypothetical protein